MATPQPGIFALGTAAQDFLEFDAAEACPQQLASGVTALHEPRTTIGGVNLVVGFRPELWRTVAPHDCPDALHGFDAPIAGGDGFSVPATQHDLILWIAGSAYDVVFDIARDVITMLEPVAALASELIGWPYRYDRDLTGFVDGTENPALGEATDVATVPAGRPGAGGSVLLLQQWVHDTTRWAALSDADQQQAMGRTKPDSVELENKPANAHIARTDQDELGKIFRRNMPYGSVTDHGTIFVGLSDDQQRLQRMLERMAGCDGGPRDALTRYTTPLTGSYYFLPAMQSLRTEQPTDGPDKSAQYRS
jgi:putative iron-dependent peroxidase